ncbi:MAG: DUF58 domain-containing protein [Candidatus Eisenbacteria bacterium]|uniref:DUF58 domain-containing protein n=1 Tax=Eiseniibacteriota bacterium TaxID=2212470 RepID=A0A538UA91_UNCEI|nr:MAG: DUF58 domain-containing protein [Candidatus Eisenbacteria bacterium]
MSASAPRAGSGAQPDRGVARGAREGRAFLDPAVVARLSHLDVRARLVVEGFIAGMHRSPFHGFSVEFAEHRPYMPGDPLKNLDWKVWGRSDRLLIKQYTEETNLRCHLLLDLSGSMAFRSPGAAMSKFEYAQSLSAALAYLMLQQQDAVGAMLFADRPLRYLPARAVRSHLDELLKTLGAAQPEGRTKLGPALHELAERIKRRGLIVLLSDLMDAPAEVLLGLQHFRHRRHEVVVFHILDPHEVDFPYTDTATFVDMESGDRLTTEPWEIAKRYRARMSAWSEQYARTCRENRIDYVRLDTRTPFDRALLAYLEKRSKLL